MRILHVVPTYLPAVRYGGPIVAVHGLARALVARGHDVSVYTTNVDGPGVSAVPVAAETSLDGVRVTYFASPFPRLYVAPEMRRVLDRSIPSFDAVHLHSVFLWPTAAAARRAARAGVPYAISPRGMLVPELLQRKSRIVKSAWLRLIERRNFRDAAAIHFTSQREWDDAQRLAAAMPLPDPHVIANGVDLFEATVPRAPQTIVALGRISWKKGLDRLIEALALVHNAHLLIAGNDDENLTPQLEELARTHGVRDRVEFLGSVHGAAKEELLASSSLLALPSHSENFGNVILEAFVARTPVVVTSGVGLAESVVAADAGLVSGETPREIAAAIERLLGDPATARRMGENGRRLVEREYAWPRVAAQMESMYEAMRARRA